MAFLVKSKNRPFWLLRYRDTTSGKWVQKSTGLRVNDRNQTRKARELRDRHAKQEQREKPTTPEEAWEHWVPNFFDLRYGAPESAKTRDRYQTSWKAVSLYLKDQNVKFPRQLRYEHVREYFNWRKSETNPQVRRCDHNSALYDLRFLGLLVDEAIRLGYADTNPCRKIGIKKHAPKVKPEFADEDIALIREKLKVELEWMRISFEIAIRHGTRLRATSIDLNRDVDWIRHTVTFHEKGHKTFTTPLSPDLLPMFERLKEEGRTRTCDLPVNASKYWTKFFRRIGKSQYCFHCCRVTTISKLARNGVPESHAIKFVGHASTEIHRVYQRLRAEDLQACHDVLRLPMLGSQIHIPAIVLGPIPRHLPPLEVLTIFDDAPLERQDFS